MQKQSSRLRRVAAPSYPVPAPEEVSEIQRRLFSGRFVDDHLSALLGRASVAISEEFHEDVRRYRMPIPHWRVLATLSDNTGISLSELAELTLLNQPTVTRLVQRLETKGLLRKATDAWDRRISRVFLTKRGHEKVDQLITLAAARQQQILQGLDAEALKASLQYLIAFCAAKRTLLRQERTANTAVRATRTRVEKRRSV
jgi:MarR family transcriptional regulator, organic hydroperoxide resistance regulator